MKKQQSTKQKCQTQDTLPVHSSPGVQTLTENYLRHLKTNGSRYKPKLSTQRMQEYAEQQQRQISSISQKIVLQKRQQQLQQQNPSTLTNNTPHYTPSQSRSPSIAQPLQKAQTPSKSPLALSQQQQQQQQQAPDSSTLKNQSKRNHQQAQSKEFFHSHRPSVALDSTNYFLSSRRNSTLLRPELFPQQQVVAPGGGLLRAASSIQEEEVDEDVIAAQQNFRKLSKTAAISPVPNLVNFKQKKTFLESESYESSARKNFADKKSHSTLLLAPPPQGSEYNSLGAQIPLKAQTKSARVNSFNDMTPQQYQPERIDSVLSSKAGALQSWHARCFNHNGKKAKYQIIGSNDLNCFYCSKCAILLASQGVQITEICSENEDAQLDTQAFHSNSHNQQLFEEQNVQNIQNIERGSPHNERQIKHEEIEKLLRQLNREGPAWENVFNLLLTKRDEVQRYYGVQCAKVENLYQEFERRLLAQKEKILEIFTFRKQQVAEVYSDRERAAKELIEDYLSIKGDIESNFDNIINTIEMDPFIEIMNNYSAKFAEIGGFFNRLSAESFKVFKCEARSCEDLIEQIFRINELSTNLIKRSAINHNSIKSHQTVNTSIHGNAKTPQKSEQDLSHLELARSPEPNSGAQQVPLGSLKSQAHLNSIYVSFENKDIFQNAIMARCQEDNENEQQIYRGREVVQQQLDTILERVANSEGADTSQQTVTPSQNVSNKPFKLLFETEGTDSEICKVSSNFGGICSSSTQSEQQCNQQGVEGASGQAHKYQKIIEKISLTAQTNSSVRTNMQAKNDEIVQVPNPQYPATSKSPLSDNRNILNVSNFAAYHAEKSVQSLFQEGREENYSQNQNKENAQPRQRKSSRYHPDEKIYNSNSIQQKLVTNLFMNKSLTPTAQDTSPSSQHLNDVLQQDYWTGEARQKSQNFVNAFATCTEPAEFAGIQSIAGNEQLLGQIKHFENGAQNRAHGQEEDVVVQCVDDFDNE